MQNVSPTPAGKDPYSEGGGGEELLAIGAGAVPAVSRVRVRVPTPRVSTARIGMQLPGWQFHACPGRRASAATASLKTYAPGKPGYLGDRPNPGLDPKPSGRIEAPAHHSASRPTSATRHPQTAARSVDIVC